MIISATVETPVSQSIRARQLEAMFDVPGAPKQKRSWRIDAPLDTKPWNIGAIIGPSGSGKSTLLAKFGQERKLKWPSLSVIDDFAPELSMGDLAAACQAVGFNTIPAWLRPFSVLSNGEQFRVSMARLLAETHDGPVVVDEFTSVVDRQVAKIASHAVAKYARKQDRQMIIASCHDDITDWLQPDWVIDPIMETFTWRDVSPRPKSQSRWGPATLRSGAGLLRSTI